MARGKSNANNFRVVVDIGGTFTDIVFLDNKGQIFTNKVLSTPDDFTRALVRGMEGIFQKEDISGPHHRNQCYRGE